MFQLFMILALLTTSPAFAKSIKPGKPLSQDSMQIANVLSSNAAQECIDTAEKAAGGRMLSFQSGFKYEKQGVTVIELSAILLSGGDIVDGKAKVHFTLSHNEWGPTVQCAVTDLKINGQPDPQPMFTTAKPAR